MQTRILIMEMLTQNPDVAKHRLVQSMPLSMVDPGSTKPNISIFLAYLDDCGRRRAPG